MSAAHRLFVRSKSVLCPHEISDRVDQVVDILHEGQTLQAAHRHLRYEHNQRAARALDAALAGHAEQQPEPADGEVLVCHHHPARVRTLEVRAIDLAELTTGLVDRAHRPGIRVFLTAGLGDFPCRVKGHFSAERLGGRMHHAFPLRATLRAPRAGIGILHIDTGYSVIREQVSA